MFEKEFNKAKNNIINFFHDNGLLDTVKLSEFRNLKKEDVDNSFDIRAAINIDKLKLDMNKTKLIEYEYTKIILENFINSRYPYMTNVERKVLINRSLKRMFNISVDIDAGLRTKGELLYYAYLVKTGLHAYPLKTYLAGGTLASVYGKETWSNIAASLETHDEKLKTNPTARQDLIAAQQAIIMSALEDLVSYDDVSDYIVRTQYIINSPVKDDLNIKELIYRADLEFLKHNHVKESAGLAKLYMLRDTLETISTLRHDEDKLKYIYEYNSIIKSFNTLQKTNAR